MLHHHSVHDSAKQVVYSRNDKAAHVSTQAPNMDQILAIAVDSEVLRGFSGLELLSYICLALESQKSQKLSTILVDKHASAGPAEPQRVSRPDLCGH